MRIPSLLVPALLIVALAPASLAEARPADGGVATVAAKQQAKGKAKSRAKAKGKARPRKSCRKGYVRKSVKVKRKGRMVRVQRCRKKPRKTVPKPLPTTPKQPATPAPTPEPGAPKPLFDPPGTRLTGAAAEPFFKRYLHGSRFTDCPGGWPTCPAEQRYSHFANGSFFACQFPMTAGAPVPPSHAYEWLDLAVDEHGAWSFSAEIVGARTFYTWNVTTDGTVTGTRHIPGVTKGAEPIPGPLRYVAGASDCTA